MRKPDVRAAPAPRLQFTQEELNTPELKKPLRKAQKAADKRDAARAKLPQQKKLVRQVSADPTTGKLSTRLTFESTTKPPSKLHHRMSDVTSAEIHQIIQNSNEDSNVSVSAADLCIPFPIWWYIAPTIINTFLESYDLTGKTIVPFATSGGSGMGKTNEMLLPSCPGAQLAKGCVFKADISKQELVSWAEQW